MHPGLPLVRVNPGSPALWQAHAEQQVKLLRIALLVCAALAVVAVVLAVVAYEPDEPGYGFLGLFALIIGLPLLALVGSVVLLRRLLRTGIERAQSGDPRLLRSTSWATTVLGLVTAVTGLNITLALPFVVAPAIAGVFGYLTVRELR